MNKFNPQKTKYLNIVDKTLKIFFHTKKARDKINWGEIKSILILDTHGIGDVIMLIPFLRTLKNNSPQASIDLLCMPYAKDILYDQNYVDHFIFLNGLRDIEKIKYMILHSPWLVKKIIEIRKKQYDIVIEPKGDLRYIFFMHFLNGKRKISYNCTGGEQFLTDVITPNDEITHLIDDKLYLLQEIGCDVDAENIIPSLKIERECKTYVDSFLERHNPTKKFTVGIHPGASLEIKRWDKYYDLIESMGNKYHDVFFMVFCSKEDGKIKNQVEDICKRVNADFIIIEESFRNYVRLISACNLFIGNDSGGAHIAAAYGIPIIDIFGPTEPSLSKPYGKEVHIISLSKNCKPCNNRTCLNGNIECIRDISCESVFSVVEDCIKNYKR